MSEQASGVVPENEHERRTLEYCDLFRMTAGESDRGLVITTAAHVEFYLERILKAFLVDDNEVKHLFEGPFAPFGTLSGKTKAAHLMGLISQDEAQRVDAMRRVRNVFAHKISASFEHPDVIKLCAKPPIYDGRLIDRDAFSHMAMNTVIHLIYRDIGIAAHHKREPLTNEARDLMDRMPPGVE